MSGRRAARSSSSRPTNVFCPAVRRLHQGQQQPARRPPPDPQPADRGAAGARRRVRHAAAGSSIPKQNVEAVASRSMARSDLNDWLTLRIDHRVAQGRELRRRSISTRCRRSMSMCPAITGTTNSARKCSWSMKAGRCRAWSAPISSTPTPRPPSTSASYTTGALLGLPGLNAFNRRRCRHRDLGGLRRLHLRLHRTVQPVGRAAATPSDKRDSIVLRQTDARRRLARVRRLDGFGVGIVSATTSNFDGKRKDTKFTPRASIASSRPRSQYLRELFAGLQRRRLRSARPDDAAPDTDATACATTTRSSSSWRSSPKPSTATNSAGRDRCSTAACDSALAAFYADYKDVQIPGSVRLHDHRDGITTFCGVTTNAGKAEIQGP